MTNDDDLDGEILPATEQDHNHVIMSIWMILMTSSVSLILQAPLVSMCSLVSHVIEEI